MSSFFALTFALEAILTTMGSMRATVPVLLTKAPMTAVTSITTISITVSLVPTVLRILPLIVFANPVCRIAPPTMKRPIIIMITGLEKPDRASAGVNTLVRISDSKVHSATMSERIFPITKKIAETANITIGVIIDEYSCLGFTYKINRKFQ